MYTRTSKVRVGGLGRSFVSINVVNVFHFGSIEGCQSRNIGINPYGACTDIFPGTVASGKQSLTFIFLPSVDLEVVTSVL